ncbi:benzoate 4-monooxygenase cytochrome P450 [Aspergillus campestris IBT 28561]|uniref:Benzoate 4-monooxygenase cytochrome P450 n=1 Tax=Aspergillus campestris (strain IBT 28561) TaxID=1392248 RepID=A0A2I1D7C6_ASPC2|nr:benzoate 4-monooxygenase cytochrome P450 [Aspergillus campestris IBT 28561]PKY05790.1 benzoate 4-monooxygenase cytochrome P450 [Aspergillus campestris IBT 28561]
MWIIPILAIGLLLLRCIYRLYLHPLSKIPGPKLAAVTRLPEFYYDVVRGGKYLWQVEKMHKKYGPVVRINPNQVHVNEPSFYSEICASGGRKRDKSLTSVGGFGLSEALPSIIDHDHHSRRRKQLNPAFSKKAIVEILPLVQQKVGLVAEHVEAAYHGENDGVVDLDAEFTGLAADTVTQYTFGKDLGFLKDTKFSNVITSSMREMTDQFHLNRFFPWLPGFIQRLPSFFICWLRPNLAGINDLQDRLHQVSETKVGGVRTVIDILNDPSLPAEARAPEFIRDNVNLILGAASDPTSGTLLVGLYHLVQRPPLWLQLRDELRGVMPSPTSPAPWLELEQLPLLKAVVNEMLRLSPGTIRIARVPVSETLVSHGHVIPPGSIVSSSARLIHMHPDPFPDPESFNPHRWLEASPEQLIKMSQALVPFSRGNRNCIGHYLATAQIYMLLSTIIRRFDLELHNTSPKDVEFARDCVVARPEKGHWSVKARVVGIATH